MYKYVSHTDTVIVCIQIIIIRRQEYQGTEGGYSIHKNTKKYFVKEMNSRFRLKSTNIYVYSLLNIYYILCSSRSNIAYIFFWSILVSLLTMNIFSPLF